MDFDNQYKTLAVSQSANVYALRKHSKELVCWGVWRYLIGFDRNETTYISIDQMVVQLDEYSSVVKAVYEQSGTLCYLFHSSHFEEGQAVLAVVVAADDSSVQSFEKRFRELNRFYVMGSASLPEQLQATLKQCWNLLEQSPQPVYEFGKCNKGLIATAGRVQQAFLTAGTAVGRLIGNCAGWIGSRVQQQKEEGHGCCKRVIDSGATCLAVGADKCELVISKILDPPLNLMKSGARCLISSTCNILGRNQSLRSLLDVCGSLNICIFSFFRGTGRATQIVLGAISKGGRHVYQQKYSNGDSTTEGISEMAFKNSLEKEEGVFVEKEQSIEISHNLKMARGAEEIVINTLDS